MKVLSLFDGISCGRVALERAGIKVDKYFSSEVDKNAIKISAKNYQDIIQLGDVRNITKEMVGEIDLLIGGSPCQDLSIVKSQTRQGLEGQKSNLFYEYIRLLNELKPKYFLLENNASMRQSDKDTISSIIGVEPIEINSADFSAQERKRLYWTNIPTQYIPLENKLVLQDILEEGVDEKYYYNLPFTIIDVDKRVCGTLEFKNHEMHKRIFNPKFKMATLTTCGGGNTQKKVLQNGRVRKLTPLEYERLQTLPDNYTSGVADGHRYSACGNGWTVDVIAHILKNIV